ncbi:PREDICTED: cilia- and flagella-associated protein 58-like [Poecilia mexicana]|uniref:cilia- and flagella-associated protein 58-like n=1 Tax=Poecilia mexicana TaxID=48701 RepID=UPI00072DD695|nr:PREDICTED: cilia- and flagella-associated protein 58-like [Poecilia mexicana]
MPKPMVYHLNNELFDIFQQEIKELHQDVAAITMEKVNTERYYEDIVSEEREEKQALLLEIQELKEKLEKAESKNQGQVGRDETTCCPTIQELQQQMKEMQKKHRDEIEMLTIEFEIDVAVAQKEIKKLQEKLENKINLDAKSDSAKREAIKSLLKFSGDCEGMKNISTEHSIKVQDEDIPHLDVQQLQEMLQRERKLRIEAEKENLDQFKISEAFFDMMEQELKTERERRAQIEADKEEAVEIAEQLIKKLEDMEKMSKEGRSETVLVGKIQMELQQLEKMVEKEKSLRVQGETEIASLLKTIESLQQEADKELQKERALREEAERGKLELEKVSDQLHQGLEKACNMTETLSAQTKLLTNKLQAEDKKRRSLLKEIQDLTLMLDKEKALRIEAEMEISAQRHPGTHLHAGQGKKPIESRQRIMKWRQ